MKQPGRLRRGALASCLVALLVGGPVSAQAASGPRQSVPPSGVTASVMRGTAGDPVPVPAGTTPGTGWARVAPQLRSASGPVDVVLGLSTPALAATLAPEALTTGALPSAGIQRARLAAVDAQQDAVMVRARALGAREQARLDTALNAVVVRVDADALGDLARIPGVRSIRGVGRYSTATPVQESASLAQAATYLGVSALRPATTGSGVRIAVVDTGIDFTHRNLGGPGTQAAYATCYAQRDVAPTGPCAAMFGATAPKVKGGTDLVGESWPNGAGAEQPDPNPIDADGHGTHVADIIAGRSADGTHLGLAPDAALYAVKACSAVASSCSGLALLRAADWVLDPNGDGIVDDAVDLVNLSLGSDYGLGEDDLTLALERVAAAGVVVVASAGNGGDRPFIVGSPSTAPSVISVAQTSLPDEVSNVIRVTSPANVADLPDNLVRLSVLQPFAGPIPASPGLVGALTKPTGSSLGCNASDFGPATLGTVALVTRGTCAVSVKAGNAQAAGATGVILVNNVEGNPGAFSYGGGGPISIPVLAIAMAPGRALEAALAAGPVAVSVDPAAALSLQNTMVASSSRGPSIDGTRVKPDIGAPGAWLTAEVGTGGQETAFGGTSGAAPTVAGVAALLLQRFPGEGPVDIKTRLLNAAETGNRTIDLAGTLAPTPISRVGAGELRAQPGLSATFRLRNLQIGGGNVSLGFQRVTAMTRLTRTVRLENLSASPRTIALALRFRDPAEAASKALTVEGTGTYTVPAYGSIDVPLRFTLQGSRLPLWVAGDAGDGGDGTILNAPEIDGTIVATDGTTTAHLGWQVLPRRSADLSAPTQVRMSGTGRAVLRLRNASKVQVGTASAFALLGTSPRMAAPVAGQPGSPGSAAARIDLLAVGARTSVADDLLEVAITHNPIRATPLYPASFAVDLDLDRDGNPDIELWNGEASGFGATGQCVVFAEDLRTRQVSADYFCTADFQSGAVVFPVDLSTLGVRAGQTVGLTVSAIDDYYSGATTDSVVGMHFTVGSRRFTIGDSPTLQVPRGSSRAVSVRTVAAPGSSSETGLLLLYPSSRRDADVVTVNP